MTAQRDLYELLGVAQDASIDEIKKAYRKKAQKHHPDLNRDDASSEQDFKDVNRAYEVLRDPAKRETYDQFGHQGLESNFGHDPFASFNTSFESIFADFFGGARTRPEDQSRNYQYEVVLTLREALSGKTIELDLPHTVKCKTCDGTGAQTGHLSTCSRCDGLGYTQIRHAFINIRQTCPACRGKGQRRDKLCNTCRGSGHTTEHKKTKIRIPAGVDDNSVIKLRFQDGANSGVLHLHIRVKPDKFFTRQGSSLFYTLEVDMIDACLGTETTINGIDGQEIKLTIPAGIQPNSHLSIRNHGMSILESKTRRGNLIVAIKISTPTHLNAEQKNLLKQFIELNSKK